MWDLRRAESEPVFSIKKVEDYISTMITNREAKYLVCASGDRCLTTINIPERRMHVQVFEKCIESKLCSTQLLILHILRTRP